MDYAAVITDLEHKRGAIDQVLDGFRELVGMGPTPAAPLKRLHAGNGRKSRRGTLNPKAPAPGKAHAAKAQPAVAPRGVQHHGKLTPEAPVKAERFYREGMSGEEIGRRLGVSGAAIAYQVAKRGWVRPPADKPKRHLTDPGYVPSA